MAISLNVADISDGSVVNGEWTGNGVFDKLIEAVNANINIQYDKGRIKGTDYANVYLGSMQAVLDQSVQYTIQTRQLQISKTPSLLGK